MKPSANTTISIARKSGAGTLSKGQKQFNKLIAQIEKQRQNLKAWHDTIPLYQQQHTRQYKPLMINFNQLRSKLVFLLDRMLTQKRFGKVERLKIDDLICSISAELMEQSPSPEIKEIFNRYHPMDFDAQQNIAMKEIKGMMEEMLGEAIGDEVELDLSDPEALMQMFAEKMQAAQQKQQDQEEQHAEQQQHADGSKKSAKELAKEAKMAAEEKQVSQSIREVYRKLASELHPDREPDEAERRRKTDLMQRVNVAYDNGDLLGLLTLQLEIEQIDQHAIAAISEDRLKHYNKVLQEQLDELEMEIVGTEMRFRAQFPALGDAALRPNRLLAELKQETADLQEAIAGLTEDLVAFEQVKGLKAFLKALPLPVPDMYDFEDDLFGFRD